MSQALADRLSRCGAIFEDGSQVKPMASKSAHSVTQQVSRLEEDSDFDE